MFALVNSLRDPRDPRGCQYPLGAVLLVALCALACRFDSFRALRQWAAAAPPSTLERLGLCRRGAFGLLKAPSSDTIRRVVNTVMPGGLEELLRVFQDRARVVAVDGKCLRGSRDAAGQAVMVLGAMLQDGTLAAQQKVADKGSEITGFAALPAALELEDAVVVADALHTQREHARVLVEEFGAHYVFPVKRNQPRAVKGMPEGALAARAGRLPLHRTRSRPHRYAGGGGGELRRSGLPLHTSDRPHHPVPHRAGNREAQPGDGVRDHRPALRPGRPAAHRGVMQAEWGIENKIHYVRDVTFGEDASRIRTGHGPQNMATLRSVAMNFLRRMGCSIADARRQLALAPHTAPLDLFGIPCDLHIHA